MKLEQRIEVIVTAAFAAANASATLFNTIADQWAGAKGDGVKPADFKRSLVSALCGEGAPCVTTHYSNRTSKEHVAYPKNTINKYLLAIDEAAFRERAARSDAGKKAAKKPTEDSIPSGYTRGQLLSACSTIGLTKAQVTALFAALA